MHLDLTTVVIGLATVVAISISFQLILLRRLGKLASARQNENATDTQDLAAAISQMLDQVTQLSATLDRKIGLEASSRLISTPQVGSERLYGPSGTPKAAPRSPIQQTQDDIPTRAATQTLDALLGATDLVVDKLEIARQAGVGVGEVELWLRRHGGRPASANQTPIGVGA